MQEEKPMETYLRDRVTTVEAVQRPEDTGAAGTRRPQDPSSTDRL